MTIAHTVAAPLFSSACLDPSSLPQVREELCKRAQTSLDQVMSTPWDFLDPDTSPAARNDDNRHGTHTAGTIAAASNGIGIVGVAPNVTIAGIKAGNAAGHFFPEAVICSFVWAADRHINMKAS